jgi:redox-sensitive bicupin YhaK (pirin superfamily)
MSLVLRPAAARGHANHGWLDSRHTFSFADYFDPAQMGFRALRVINDDIVRPGTGFGMHGHRDMEIVSYVVAGELTHTDTTGSTGVLCRGDVQYMNAGTGIRHSEVNASVAEDVRLLQIWILPPRPGLPPSYHQEAVSDADKHNVLALIAGPEGSGAALVTHRDVRVYAALLEAGRALTHPLNPGRGVWIQVVDGSLAVNGVALESGDGAAIEGEETIRITAPDRAEFLLFDLD